MKVDALEGALVKHLPTGSHASKHRMSVPRCLFLYARNAVEAVKSLAPRLPGVLRWSSRTVRCLAFSRIMLKSVRAPNGSSGYKVIVTDLCQNRAENGLFAHPTRNAFCPGAPESSVFEPHERLHGHSVRNVVQSFQGHESSKWKSRPSAMVRLINALSILDNVRKTPSTVESLLAKSGGAIFENARKKT